MIDDILKMQSTLKSLVKRLSIRYIPDSQLIASIKKKWTRTITTLEIITLIEKHLFYLNLNKATISTFEPNLNKILSN